MSGLLGVAGVLAGSSSGMLAALGLGAYAAAISVTTVGSHVLADALTPAGIRPLAPWRSRHYSYDLVTSGSLLGNYGLLAAGVAASVGALVLGSAIAGLG